MTQLATNKARFPLGKVCARSLNLFRVCMRSRAAGYSVERKINGFIDVAVPPHFLASGVLQIQCSFLLVQTLVYKWCLVSKRRAKPSLVDRVHIEYVRFPVSEG